MGLDSLMASAIREHLRVIFAQNQITPAVAADEVRTMQREVERLATDLDQVLAVLARFRIGAEQLNPGEAEVGVLIPRSAVDNELSQLGRELLEVQQIIAPFQELATGSHDGIEVAAISSSDFGLFLSIDP